MVYNPDIHHRCTIRIADYDYSREGAYFVTISVHDRECLFGEIANGEVILNDMGRIVAEEWRRTETVRTNFITDEFIVMPNHVHGILFITDTGESGNEPVGAIPAGRPDATGTMADRGMKPCACCKGNH